MWGSIGGAALGGAAAYGQYLGNKKANEMSRDMSREQMAFQERMSSSAHQRETVDLEKAGLNRILSLGGSGASSPGGAMPNVRSMAEGASATAAQTARSIAEVRAINAGTRKTNAEADIATANAKGSPGTGALRELKSDLIEWGSKMLRIGGSATTGAVKKVWESPVKVRRAPHGLIKIRRNR